MNSLLRLGLKKGHPILARLYRWYSSFPHTYRAHGVKVKVMPGIFHPGWFYSTTLLINYLSSQDLRDQSLLELGCGTGMISVLAAQSGAKVTASDINPRAVENAALNASINQVEMTVLKSDLLTDIQGSFDWIIINPPYYPKDPANLEQAAWFCGADFEYFKELFEQIRPRIRGGSKVIMVLSEDCDLKSVLGLAQKNGLILDQRVNETINGELNFLFQIGFAGD